MVRRTHFIAAALVTALIAFASLPACAQSGRTFYIDYASGSNSNPGTKASPWKSHPYMPAGAGCTGTGAAPAYSHQAGDNFIFKGGVTWPSSCFTMSIAAGGTASTSDYYGVDQSWYSGSSWAQPLWDLNYANVYYVVYAAGINYITLDNIEIARQGIAISASNSFNAYSALFFSGCTAGVLVENMNIHGWAGDSSHPVGTSSMDYAYGSIFANQPRNGCVAVRNSIVQNSDGYFYSGGAKVTGVGFGGACYGCGEVSGSTFHDVMAACFNVTLCHGNQFYAISGDISLYDGSIHSQVIEDDDNSGPDQIYDNLIHDLIGAAGVSVGVVINVCEPVSIYNNVIWNYGNSSAIDMSGENASNASDACGDANSSTVARVYNNTIDSTFNGSGAIVRTNPHAGETINGTLDIRNNLWVTGGNTYTFGGSIGTQITTPNTVMSSSTASSQGYTASNKYASAAGSAGTVNIGVNLSTLCSGGLSQLCSDASGTFWFGGSYNERPTGSTAWTAGAYELGAAGQAQSSKPNPPTNLTASVQ